MQIWYFSIYTVFVVMQLISHAEYMWALSTYLHLSTEKIDCIVYHYQGWNNCSVKCLQQIKLISSSHLSKFSVGRGIDIFSVEFITLSISIQNTSNATKQFDFSMQRFTIVLFRSDKSCETFA